MALYKLCFIALFQSLHNSRVQPKSLTNFVCKVDGHIGADEVGNDFFVEGGIHQRCRCEGGNLGIQLMNGDV